MQLSFNSVRGPISVELFFYGRGDEDWYFDLTTNIVETSLGKPFLVWYRRHGGYHILIDSRRAWMMKKKSNNVT